MKQANIAYTRNNLSKLLAEVREGASVLIMDRQQPVARLEPVGAVDGHASYQLNDLARRGLIRMPLKKLDTAWLQEALPVAQGDIVAALKYEREQGL